MSVKFTRLFPKLGMDQEMIRPYIPADLEQTVNLFTRTVHIISSKYYSPEEVEAWAPLQPDTEAWSRFLSERYTLVVESECGIAGFGCLRADGSTVDMLFTHHEHQSKGIGSTILDALETEAARRGSQEVLLTASATAWSFYQKRGYQYHHSEKKTYGTVVFDCQILRKVLPFFPDIRRKDRLLDDHRAITLLGSGEYGFLSMCAVNGYGYGIPVNYALADSSIYFHCAPTGFKLENIRRNNRVSFCVVGHTQVLPRQFTTVYESVVAFGLMIGDLSEEERYRALRLLVEKYSPGHVIP